MDRPGKKVIFVLKLLKMTKQCTSQLILLSIIFINSQCAHKFCYKIQSLRASSDSESETCYQILADWQVFKIITKPHPLT